MSSYSSSDINDAKRRVEEMRKRSIEYVASDKSSHKSEDNDSAYHESTDVFGGILSNLDSKDSSKALILALILVLSREGADNSLILALLYILL